MIIYWMDREVDYLKMSYARNAKENGTMDHLGMKKSARHEHTYTELCLQNLICGSSQ